MAEKQQGFVWYELMTTDTAGAAAFYATITGWKAGAVPGAPAENPYQLFCQPKGMAAGGLMPLPAPAAAMGVPPNWLGYVDVPDVEAALAKALSLGATLAVPVTEVPNMVRFACIRDPQGAALGLLSPINPPPDAKPDYASPGQFGWHELYAADWEAAFGFYSAMFGWRKDVAMDIGEMGTYQLFAFGSTAQGGMMNKPPMLPVACWMYYINVANIDAALAAITAGGGQVMMGPHQVPGGNWIVQAKDPQGAAFAVVGPKAA